MGGNIFEIFRINSEGLLLQRQRLTSIAKNIANANTTRTENGEPYRREIVIARAKEDDSAFHREINNYLTPLKILREQVPSEVGQKIPETQYLDIEIKEDMSEGRLVYDPSHPDADENGYVRYPNVNVVTEMVEMITAQRAFEANVSVIESAKNVARDSLDI
jgi:flagellar basal-body rod protein FlgC